MNNGSIEKLLYVIFLLISLQLVRMLYKNIIFQFFDSNLISDLIANAIFMLVMISIMVCIIYCKKIDLDIFSMRNKKVYIGIKQYYCLHFLTF